MSRTQRLSGEGRMLPIRTASVGLSAVASGSSHIQRKGNREGKAPLRRAILSYTGLSHEGVKPDVAGLPCPVAIEVTMCPRSAAAHGYSRRRAPQAHFGGSCMDGGGARGARQE